MARLDLAFRPFFSRATHQTPTILKTHLAVLRQIWEAPGNRGSRIAAVIRALRWFLRCRRRVARPLLHPVFGGQRVFPCYIDSIIAKHVMYRSEWFDWDLMHFMAELLRSDDRYLDIGANVGLHVLNASRFVAADHIICVEPNPLNLERLRFCLRTNRIESAAILPVAASNHGGTTRLVGDDVFSRVEEAGTENRGLRSGFEVKTVRLDDVVPMEMIHLTKLDVEGAEWQALVGLESHIEKGLLPVLVIELLGHGRTYGVEEKDLVLWLQKRGYHLGAYRHDEHRFDFESPLHGDVWALSDKGIDWVAQRMGFQARLKPCRHFCGGK